MSRFRLLAPHFIDSVFRGKGEVVENVAATPLMEGLDDAGKQAVVAVRLRVWGRYPGVPYGFPTYGPPLDDPPIPRPLDDNQPVYHFVGTPEYSR